MINLWFRFFDVKNRSIMHFYYSLNKNQLRDLSLLLSKVVLLMPHLKHLSLLGNSACPHPIFSSSQENYARYLLNFFCYLFKEEKKEEKHFNQFISVNRIWIESQTGHRSDVKLGQQNFDVSVLLKLLPITDMDIGFIYVW